ncbi:hypothetical protein [Mycolicibacterium agri]
MTAQVTEVAGMAFREVSVNEIREVLRVWLGVAGLPAPGYRTIAAYCGLDRKTVRRYVEAAQAAGLRRDDDLGAVDDALIGMVADAVRPVRPDGHGAAWEQLLGFEEQITAWVAGTGGQRPLTVTKIHTLLARQGCVVPYRTLHRFASERCGFGRKDLTVRVADGDPGVECQVDFGYLGMLTDADDGRRRKVHALIFTAVYSRHMFVWLSYSQTLTAVIAGCEAAWEFFGGVFAVLIPDNLKPVIADADAVNPQFTHGWLDYAGHAGFLTDPARVASPKDKPRVERAVQYVRRNFWDGETFTSIEAAQQPLRPGVVTPRAPYARHHVRVRPSCSPPRSSRRCCRCRGFMTCRCSRGSRCIAISTPRSPRRCIRCPSAGSVSTSTCGPIPSW